MKQLQQPKSISVNPTASHSETGYSLRILKRGEILPQGKVYPSPSPLRLRFRFFRLRWGSKIFQLTLHFPSILHRLPLIRSRISKVCVAHKARIAAGLEIEMSPFYSLISKSLVYQEELAKVKIISASCSLNDSIKTNNTMGNKILGALSKQDRGVAIKEAIDFISNLKKWEKFCEKLNTTNLNKDIFPAPHDEAWGFQEFKPQN